VDAVTAVAIAGRPELDMLTLERCRRGNTAAFGDLVRFYERPVFALLSRMLTGRRSLVEDLAQETFVRAFSAIHRFESTGRLSSWLLTIATHLALDVCKKRELAFEPLVDASADAVDLDAPDLDFALDRRELARAIEHAMTQLAPTFRATFLLREVHELDYEAIAAATDVDVGTVKSRLFRAKRHLRLLLKGVYDDR
jgi:RNA polymerase sigma-70 factor (ECF subfamily)